MPHSPWPQNQINCSEESIFFSLTTINDKNNLNNLTMIQTGIKGRLEETVTPEMSAARVGSGLEDVFATPMMIALVEKPV